MVKHLGSLMGQWTMCGRQEVEPENIVDFHDAHGLADISCDSCKNKMSRDKQWESRTGATAAKKKFRDVLKKVSGPAPTAGSAASTKSETKSKTPARKSALYQSTSKLDAPRPSVQKKGKQ